MKQSVFALFASLALVACQSAVPPAKVPIAPTPAAAPAAKPGADASSSEPTEPTEREIPGYQEPPAPQQSPAEEKAESNAPGEPAILSVDPKLLLDGNDFPARQHYEVKYAEPDHTYYVFADAAAEGDGSEGHPWKQLQAALCRLMPGDRLILLPAIYEGNFVIGEGCQDGTAAKPIQVFAHDSFFKSPEAGTSPTITMRRAFWQFYEIQIGMGHSHPVGFLVEGPTAHDISIDHSHLYEGEGPALHIRNVRNLTLSNSHIHHSHGVDIDGGSSDITLIGNHIHHNRTTALRVGVAPGDPVAHLSLIGNKFHNDRGQAMVIDHCNGASIRENKIYNYRKGDDWAGVAVDLRGGLQDLTFESNYVVESDTGIRIGNNAAVHPRMLTIARNFFENTLTPDGVALEIDGANSVRINNNMFNKYDIAMKITGDSRSVANVTLANNIIIANTAWTVVEPTSLSYIGHNLFEGPSMKVVNGTRSSSLADQLSQMPGSHVVDHIDFAGRDLAAIGGTPLVDAGASFDWIQFKGGAPDIGIDEK